MPNPLFNALNGNTTRSDSYSGMMQRFQEFQKQMQGKNPDEEVQRLLQSGKISQAQLNQAQQMARQMQSVFGK